VERILIVAAHPDDEILGCGGTMLAHCANKDEVCICILGEGVASRSDLTESERESHLKNLRQQSRDVASFLKVKDLVQEQVPDNRFDTVPLLDLVKKIEECIDRFRPNRVYTHHGGDLNIDHVMTHRAVMTAVRPMKENIDLQCVYAFEIPSSTEWAFTQFEPAFRAQHFVDISRYIEQKVQAMSMYSGEARSFPHPRSGNALRSLAQYRGSSVGYDSAEAFEVIYQRIRYA
jgi:LmbE family N-acetylglucosaminyl deacetylase